MKLNPDHKNNLDALRRIEGQIRGIQKMIDGKRYCVDILTQLSAVSNAIGRVQDNILSKHLNSCVKKAMQGTSEATKDKKIEEVIKLLKTFRRGC